MQGERSHTEILQLMLLDILQEAELIRAHDPARAAHLDDAANDLRAVIAEKTATAGDPEARR